MGRREYLSIEIVSCKGLWIMVVRRDESMNYSLIGTSFSHNNGMEGEVVGLRVKTHWVCVKNGG